MIGLGGALGAIARHALNGWVARLLPGAIFPFGILIVNVLGSGIIGWLAGLIASGRMEISIDTKAFLMIGVLGGFTTFSSFSLDTLLLVRGGHWPQAALNVTAQLALGLLAVFAGYRAGGGGQ